MPNVPRNKLGGGVGEVSLCWRLRSGLLGNTSVIRIANDELDSSVARAKGQVRQSLPSAKTIGISLSLPPWIHAVACS